jgi:hypothetical protein
VQGLKTGDAGSNECNLYSPRHDTEVAVVSLPATNMVATWSRSCWSVSPSEAWYASVSPRKSTS